MLVWEVPRGYVPVVGVSAVNMIDQPPYVRSGSKFCDGPVNGVLPPPPAPNMPLSMFDRPGIPLNNPAIPPTSESIDGELLVVLFDVPDPNPNWFDAPDD